MITTPKINQPEPPKSAPGQQVPETSAEQKPPEVVEKPLVVDPVVQTAEVVEKPLVVDPVVQTVIADESAFSARERTPSDWEINPVDDGTIWARNSATARIFEGTMAEFNKKLRG